MHRIFRIFLSLWHLWMANFRLIIKLISDKFRGLCCGFFYFKLYISLIDAFMVL